MSKTTVLATLIVGFLLGIAHGNAKVECENFGNIMKNLNKVHSSIWDPRDKESAPADDEYEKKSTPEYNEDDE